MGIILESNIVECLIGFLAIFWVLFLYTTKKYSYWKDRGVPYHKPSFPFGSLGDVFLARKFIGHHYDELYRQFKGEAYFGVFEGRNPVWIVRDPELIKKIMTKDFQHFFDRIQLPIDPKIDYVSLHLVNMSGKEWKQMRMKLTPTFSSGKLKAMFSLMGKCGEQLRDHVENDIKRSDTLDVKDILARFTMDTIATCAFGLEINSLSNKDCEFYNILTSLLVPKPFTLFRRLLISVLPFLTKFYTVRFVPKYISDFMTHIVKNTVEYRKKNNVRRNDFLDLLIDIRQTQNNISTDDNPQHGNLLSEVHSSSDTAGLTIEEMIAQAFVFFVAGFETASSTMTFCLYELAQNQEIQEKVYQEIISIFKKHDGEITYQALQEMTYMDQVINETLRLYASVPALSRICTETYNVPDSELVIEKGMKVVIPTFALHHDPQFYPQPYKFDPQRFSPDNVKQRHSYVHLPFGEGPRICIGMRFGLLQTKIGLAEMISRFEFKMTPKTQVPIVLKTTSFLTTPDQPIVLNVTKRNIKAF